MREMQRDHHGPYEQGGALWMAIPSTVALPRAFLTFLCMLANKCSLCKIMKLGTWISKELPGNLNFVCTVFLNSLCNPQEPLIISNSPMHINRK